MSNSKKLDFNAILKKLDLFKSQPSAQEAEDDEKNQDVALADEKEDGLENTMNATPPHDEEAENNNIEKSFSVEINGEQVKAIDATDLINSMQEKMNGIEKTQSDSQDAMLKALNALTDVVTAQTKAMQEIRQQVNAVSNTGQGRKSVLTADPSSLAKSMLPETPEETMTKCDAAFLAGKIDCNDVARAEAAFNRGVPIPGDIVARLQ